MKNGTTRRAALAAITGTLLATASAAHGGQHRPTVPTTNVIRICTDDMRADDINARIPGGAYLLPNLRSLRTGGINFTHHYTAFGKCDPSRVSMQTGLYVTHHGVISNEDSFHRYRDLGLEADSLPAHAKAHGILTGHVGKLVTAFGLDPNDQSPPCYDYSALFWKTFEHYTNFTLNENNTLVDYHNGEYCTDVLGQRCLDFLESCRRTDDPNKFYQFFLEYWPNACHGPNVPSSLYVNTVDPQWMPIPPSYGFVIGSSEDLAIKQKWAERIETLRSVDDTIGLIVGYLQTNNLLASTHILFTSDNGFMEGEHGIFSGKGNLLVECMRMPLIWFGPGVQPLGNIAALSSNVDVAATIADIFGILSDWTVIDKPIDGRSMVQLFSNNTTNWDKAKLIQSPGPGSLDVENGIVTLYWWYTVAVNGTTKRLFDMKNDPYQITNQINNPDPIYVNAIAALAPDLEALKNCSGTTCSIGHTYPPPPHH